MSKENEKVINIGFGLLKEIIESEKKQTVILNGLISPLNMIKEVNDKLDDIGSTLSRISLNVSSIAKMVMEKRTGIEYDSISIIQPIADKIGELRSDLNKKDIVKKDTENGLKALGGATVGISKLITTAGNVNPSAGKNIMTVLDSVNNGVDKANSKKNSFLDFTRAISGVGSSILGFAGSLVLATPLLILGIPSMMLLSLAMRTMTLSIDEKSVGDLGKGLMLLSLGLATLGFGIYAFAQMATTSSVIGAILTVGILGTEMALLGMMSKNIKSASFAIGLIGLSLISLGFGLAIFGSLATVGNVLGTILTVGLLGVEFAILGKFAVDVLLGAFSVGAIGLSIMVLGYGLKSFTDSGIDIPTSLGLVSLITVLGAEYTVAGIASPLIGAGALAIGAIGVSLISLGFGLNQIKDIKWDENNSKSLYSAITGVSSAFSFLGSNPFNAISVYMGIKSISGIGTSLSSLASGIVDFANMQFTEYDVKDGKVIVKSKISLTNEQIKNAAFNISNVIGTIGKPFADIGKLEAGMKPDGSGSGLTLLDYIFAGGFVQMGVKSISNVGQTLSSLAQGVQSFANMQFIEHEVKDGKIVPKKITPLSDAAIDTASINISKVLSVIGKSFADIGKANYGEKTDNSFISAIFGGGQNLIKTGVSVISGLGSNLSSLADAVIKFASMEYTEHEIINGKLVNKRIVKIGKPELDLATKNIEDVLTVIAKAYSNIGRMEDESDGIFKDGYLKKGSSLMRGLGTDLVQMTDVVIKLSSGTVPITDTNGKITSTVPINSETIKLAGQKISDILTVTGNAISNYGQTFDNEKFLKSKQSLESTKILVSTYVDIQNLITKIPNQTKEKIELNSFNGFDLNKIALNSELLIKAGDGTLKIGNGLKIMSESINSMDLKKLTLTDSMFNSLAQLSKVNGGIDNLGTEIKESIETSFKQLSQFLQELSGQNMNNTNSTISNQTKSFDDLFTKIQEPKIQENKPFMFNQQPVTPISNNIKNETIDKLNSILSELNTTLTNIKILKS